MLSTAIKLLGLPSETTTTTTQYDPPTHGDAHNPTATNDQKINFQENSTNNTTIDIDNETNDKNNEPATNTAMDNSTDNVSAASSNTSTKKTPNSIITKTKTSFRILYDTCDADFNIIKTHYELIAHIKQMDDNLVIYPNNPTSQPYKDLKFLPTNEKEFKDQFTVHDSNINRATVCINISTTKPLNELKYILNANARDDSPLLQFMKSNNIIARQDKFHHQSTASTGFFIFINPDIVFRDEFRDKVNSALKQLDIMNTNFDKIFNSSMVRNIPTFEVSFGSVSYRHTNGRLITSKVLDLQCAEPELAFLKELLCSIDFSKTFKRAVFIPRGLNQLNSDPYAYKKYVDHQIAYLKQTTHFAITGLHKHAINYQIDSDFGVFTPYSVLLESDNIEAIHPTPNTNTKGTWLIVSTNLQVRDAANFFDTEIEQLYKHIPDDPALIYEDTPIPTRIQRQRFANANMMMQRSLIIDRLVPDIINIPKKNPSATKTSSTSKGRRSLFTTESNQYKPNRPAWRDQSTGVNDTTASTNTLCFTTMEQKMENATEKMSMVETNIKSIESKMTTIDTKMENLDNKMVNVDTQITEQIKSTVESTIQSTLQAVISNNINKC
jgi:hypothetical protein